MTRGAEHLRVLITGEPYFVRQLQVQLAVSLPKGVYLPDWKRVARLRKALILFRELLRADVWYQLQGCAGRGWSCELALHLGVPVVLHWLGTDVSDALRYFRRHPNHLPLLQRMTHWTFSPWLTEELTELGIQAPFMPFPQEKVAYFLQASPPPLPEHFKIVTYIRDERPEFYGWKSVLALARAFPELPIQVLGTEGSFASAVPPNVTFCGWVEDPAPTLRESSVLVRMTEHDGLSGLVLETLSLGRHVLWTYAIPGVRKVNTVDELIEQVKDLYQAFQRGDLTLNLEGRTYVATQLNPHQAITHMVEGLRKAAEKSNRFRVKSSGV